MECFAYLCLGSQAIIILASKMSLVEKWIPTSSDKFSSVSIDIHQFPWVPINLHEFSCMFMNYHAFPWISMSGHEELGRGEEQIWGWHRSPHSWVREAAERDGGRHGQQAVSRTRDCRIQEIAWGWGEQVTTAEHLTWWKLNSVSSRLCCVDGVYKFDSWQASVELSDWAGTLVIVYFPALKVLEELFKKVRIIP